MSDTCAGCGKDLSYLAYADLSNKEEHRGMVFCPGRNGAKKSCVDRARSRLNVCALCGCAIGWHLGGFPVVVVCEQCEEEHEYGKRRKAQDSRELKHVELSAMHWRDADRWGYSSHTQGEDRFFKALVRVIDPGAPADYTRVTLRVPKAQAEAIDQLMSCLKEAFEAAREHGLREGSSILRALAEGKATVSDFNDRVTRGEK